jgi:transcriptional regulator with XRE-family HTH domain
VVSGRRIRLYRQRLGMTQEVLAGLADVSPSWLSQVERGVRAPDSLRCLIPVAEVLGVDPMDLIEAPRKRERTVSGALDGVRELVTTLRKDPWRLVGRDPDLDRLAGRVVEAEALRRECRYSEVGPLLAGLIADAETAVRAHQDTEQEAAAFTWLSHTYQTAAYTLFRAGEGHSITWIASERCAAAACRSDDPVIQALGSRCRAYVLSHAGWEAEAMDTIMAAIDALAPASDSVLHQPAGDPWWSPDPSALFGALLLDAAKAAARGNDRPNASRLLREAETTATRVTEESVLFGPANVAAYRVIVAIEFGDATEAVRLGSNIEASSLLPFKDRPAMLHIDVGRGYAAKGGDEAALHRILEAERLAPEMTHQHAVVRELVSAMVHRRESRSAAPGLRELAARLGVLN